MALHYLCDAILSADDEQEAALDRLQPIEL